MSSVPVVTIFADKTGSRINAARAMDFPELERVIRSAKTAPDKAKQPLLKLAAFGTVATDKGSFRHDANVLSVSGVEGDYDAGQVPMQQAAERLSAKRLTALLYTSASHEPTTPKWRVIVPLSRPLEGSEEELYDQRRHWAGVLNAILGGILTPESFVLSQCYFFGPIKDRPTPEIIRISGCCIDELEAIPEPVFPINGVKHIGEPGTNWDPTPDADLRAAFERGEGRYQAMKSLSARWAARGMPSADIEAALQSLLDKCPNGSKNADGVDFRDHCGPLAASAVDKFGETRRTPRQTNGAAGNGEAIEWAAPMNLFAELSAPPFEPRELPEELSAYPRLYASQTGIDINITLTAAVAAAAAAICDNIQVCADSSSRYFAQPRVWILNIGAPGAGKTPGQREMLAPLWELHSERDAEWRAAIRNLAEDEPKPPRPRVILGDTTLEALSDVLADNPRGILVATDEFDAWLGAMDQYRTGGVGRDRGEWLRLFDGGPHSIERVKRGTVFVPNWGCSILTATTPAAMQRLTRHLPEDGLLQRFIVVLARRQGEVIDAPAREKIDAERDRYTETVRRLWNLGPHAHKGIVPLSFEAKNRFDAWRTENRLLQEALGNLNSALEGHIAKYPTLALRIALTFHCARIVNLQNASARDPAAWPVPLETLELALAFLRRASQHAIALYMGRKGGSDAYELARTVARWLLARRAEENARGMQRRHLVQGVYDFRKADEGLQTVTLRLLVDLGWLREEEGGYLKAQPTRFVVNPHIVRTFATLAEQERERRALVRERIAEAAAERRQERGGLKC